MAFVPTAAIVTASSVPKRIVQVIGSATVHGLVAATLLLAVDRGGTWAKYWRAVWPSKDDFRQSHPLLWNSELQSLLPPAAQGDLDFWPPW